MNEKALLSLVGNRDPYVENNPSQKGPLLTLLDSKGFHGIKKVFLLYTPDKEGNALKTKAAIVKHFKEINVESFSLDIKNPSDILEVFKALRNFITENGKLLSSLQLYIAFSSGTPQMQISLFLLTASRQIIGTLVYQPDPKYGGRPVEIDPWVEDFPEISLRLPSGSPEELLTVPEEVRRVAEEELNIFIGRSRGFRNALIKVAKCALHEEPVLITGESGTGKELFAKLIHRLSKRKDKPFIAVNVGAIDSGVFSSQLFGHKKGSFTGAIQDQMGYFQLADKGTLFLDEIGDCPLNIQTALLRAIEQGEIQPVGEPPQKVDIRYIFATNKDLNKMIEEGKFRKDLYHRITFEIDIPSLRERREDLRELINFLLKKDNKQGLYLTESAYRKLLNYHFPGNIRELKNILHRAALHATDGKILPEHIDITSRVTKPDWHDLLPEPYEGFKLSDLINEIREFYLKMVYEKTEGNASKAANLLGYSHVNVIKQWKRLHLL